MRKPHKTQALSAPWSWTCQPSDLCEVNFCCWKATQFTIFCCNSPNEIRRLSIFFLRCFAEHYQKWLTVYLSPLHIQPSVRFSPFFHSYHHYTHGLILFIYSYIPQLAHSCSLTPGLTSSILFMCFFNDSLCPWELISVASLQWPRQCPYSCTLSEKHGKSQAIIIWIYDSGSFL